MLDPRIYRAALLPVVLALIVCAFSLSDRPRPIGTTLRPDAFSEASRERAMADLDSLASTFPARRPGDSGDAAMAARLATMFRAIGYQVSTPSFEGETVDGKRRLTTVIARQIGQPGPGLVVVAHRDALARRARAELSGTAVMLELARIVRGSRLHRTVTFVSTSGGSGGLAGARDVVHRLSGPTDAVIVLGDVGGRTVRRPFVPGWSNGDGVGNLQLRRTLEAAVRTEAATNPGGSRATSQWAPLALALAFAWLLGLTGLLPATPPAPVPGGAIPFDGVAKVGTGAVALVAVLGWLLLRPALLRRAGVRGRYAGEGAGSALLVAWCGLALVLWLVNPYAAMLMVPGAHLLLAVVAPEVRLRRSLALGLVALSALPFLLVDLSIAGQLGLSPLHFGWFCLLLVAGGVVGPLTWVIYSLLVACVLAAVLVALRSRPAAAAPEEQVVTMRGPLTYAGPGSLGGTESALRR
jgi:hypothetical protein